MQRSTQEIQEIERHKYFMSEKRGYDVGWEAAEEDWDQNFGRQWRRDGEQNVVSTLAGPNGETGAPTETVPMAEEVGPTSKASGVVHLAHCPSEPESSAGRLRRWWTRFFAK